MMSKTVTNQIVKYFTKQASLSELDQLSQWIEDPVHKEEFAKYVKINHAIDFNVKKFDTDHSKQQLLKFIEQEKRALRIRRVLDFSKYAALLLIFVSIAFLIKNEFQTVKQNPMDSNITLPVAIGDKNTENGVILTLEDGSNLNLEKGQTVHTKNLHGNGEELIYDSSNVASGETVYNYLTVPRGGQFQLKLADGTLVWLNSESQLKYPVAFIAGKSRIVDLVYGEAYFEVSPSTEHGGATFRVTNRSQEVEVLGTAFNIKAYKDEAYVYTTLVEGKIGVAASGENRMLSPNQQSKVAIMGNNISVAIVDVTTEISWKNGIYSFREKPLKDIMRVVSRWYDIDVVFENKELETIKFRGMIDKNQTIEEILSIIASTKINSYKIENKTLILK